MLQWIASIAVLSLLECAQFNAGLSTSRIRESCSTSDTINIIGGLHNRLVTEGGRITLTCCMPGVTNGHDHEQLAWYDPNGRKLSNHFANAHSKFEHLIYTVPDFRSHGHLVSMLVIQRFRLEDAGTYTCRKANANARVDPAMVTLDIRPRLLADYIPIEVAENNGNGIEVVAGRPAFVALEEGRRGKITCRINPNFSAIDIHITWYFQGRQLIAPSFALGGSDQRRPGNTFDRADDIEQLLLMNTELAAKMLKPDTFAMKQPFDAPRRDAVSVDPAELGIQIVDNGQVLQISRVGQRHYGVYICKAEATSDSAYPDGILNDSEQLPTKQALIQMQAIRGIVYTPPRMLPGSPKEIFSPPTHETANNEQEYIFNKRRISDEKTFAPMWPASRYYMQPEPKSPQKLGQTTAGITIPVVQEGGKLVLECEARGKPSPRLLWFRGGVGVSRPGESRTVNFDQSIKQSLEHASLDDVQPQLGIQIADNENLLQAITHSLGERNSVNEKLETGDPTQAFDGNLYSQFGRFELTVSRRPDDTGDPVISVSRLSISHLKPSDATRYTCLALLDLGDYGGSGNYTDVGSVFPEVVLRPRFIKSGTRLDASGYPGENVTLTCEAFGGLPHSNGLRIRLLRGPDVPKLIRILTGPKRYAIREPELASNEATRDNDNSGPVDGLVFRPGMHEYTFRGKTTDQIFKFDDISGYNSRIGNGSVQVVRSTSSPRYLLSMTNDPRNPYISILTLHITDLVPEDNSFYACEALSGPHWRSIAPTAHEGVGHVTVWFAPTRVNVQGSGANSSTETTTADDEPTQDTSKGTVYGLLHRPSKLKCQSLGKPTPTWSWKGPQTDTKNITNEAGGPQGFKHMDYTDGEMSVSELMVPAGYSNVGVFGTYSCTASNRLGSATGTIRLKLATHPGRPSMRACKVEAKLIELCVEPPEETGGLPLTHYELRIQTHPREAFIGPFAYLPGPRLLRLPNLIPGYYYRFALSAVSPAGRGPNAYLQVTTNRLSMPALKMLTSPEYIEPTAYNLHWKTAGGNGPEIDQYRISIRPVEVDFSMGEVRGRPIGDWTDYTVQLPSCYTQVEDIVNDTVCRYRIPDLKPNTAYELELSGENFKGFSEAQRIIFRTSSFSGQQGQMLNTPAYLRQTAGNSAGSQRSTMLVLLILVYANQSNQPFH